MRCSGDLMTLSELPQVKWPDRDTCKSPVKKKKNFIYNQRFRLASEA